MNSIFYTGHLYLHKTLFLFFQISTLYLLNGTLIGIKAKIQVTLANKQKQKRSCSSNVSSFKISALTLYSVLPMVRRAMSVL